VATVRQDSRRKRRLWLVRPLHRLVGMTTNEATAQARTRRPTRIQWTEIARRAKHGITELQSNFEGRMKNDPYAAVGIATVAGIGVGIVLGSRILRTALASAVSYGIVELARSLVEERIPIANGFRAPPWPETGRSSHS
jgi:hypothetical protein